jgi:hypothetical protein
MTQDIASCSAGEEIQLFMELEVCDISQSGTIH